MEAAGAVEYGIADAGSGAADVAGEVSVDVLANDPAADCVRDLAGDRGVELDTPQGLLAIPSETEHEAAQAAATRSYPSTSSAVRYRTCIPKETATTSYICGTFKGDDRDFTSYYSASNRTRTSMFFNWPSRTIDTTKGVSATHRLKAYSRIAKTKTASSSGIKFHTPVMSRTYGRIAINHSVGNPLCWAAGPIKYNVVVEVWKNGAARISGTRVKAPNHEAYLYRTTGSYGKTIFRKRTTKFFCLTLPCGVDAIYESTS